MFHPKTNPKDQEWYLPINETMKHSMKLFHFLSIFIFANIFLELFFILSKTKSSFFINFTQNDQELSNKISIHSNEKFNRIFIEPDTQSYKTERR